MSLTAPQVGSRSRTEEAVEEFWDPFGKRESLRPRWARFLLTVPMFRPVYGTMLFPSDLGPIGVSDVK